MADSLLSSLCAICHGNPHKYRCPRCGILTCSLPCVKRHKKWAQCNGVRDPTVYLKRADLATPKALDNDYNYLTSIEREFDRAERDRSSRGIIFGGEDKKFAKGEANLRTALRRCAVTVKKAPKGLNRSRVNKTKWLKKDRCLEWTVEWIKPNGEKCTKQCREDANVAEAYERMVLRRRPETANGQQEMPGAPSGTDIAFYLQIPSMPSKQTVVASIDGRSAFKDALHGRHILEFPTIYVLEQKEDDALPAEFILEEDFFHSSRKHRPESPTENLSEEGEIPEDDLDAHITPVAVDGKKLIEVLGKDLQPP